MRTLGDPTFALLRKGGGRDQNRAWHAHGVTLLVLLGLLLGLLPAGCRGADGFDQRLNVAVGPYRFSILRWELGHILEGPQRPTVDADRKVALASELQLVAEYFALTEQIRAIEWEINAIASGGAREELPAKQRELTTLRDRKAALAGNVEWILGWQVREAFRQEGIYNPADRYVALGVAFPPMNFRLARPPNVLVVSPRDRIESMREVMVVQEIDLETVEAIEEQVDALGVSSLVIEIGGFGATYPTFVADDASLLWTIATVAEEWLHQYLAFTPLGFMYLFDALGVKRDYEIATMNETVAGIVSDEIAAQVYRKYYQVAETAPTTPPAKTEEPAAPRFDFNREMRQIRLMVDGLLAQGRVEQAEDLMEERRQYLASQGYYIRKLNQAYFAFHGTYADEPTSVSPIGVELRELRQRSHTLREFLNRAASMTKRQDLVESVR